MKYKFAVELRPALLVGRNGRHDLLKIHGEERTAWHPAVGPRVRSGAGVPCLVAVNMSAGEAWYTVAAVQISCGDGGKAWVCVQPVLLERAAIYFLESGWMDVITGEYGHAARSPEAGKCRLDFDNGSVYAEVCIPAAVSGRAACRAGAGLLSSADYLLSCGRMREAGKRMVCLVVCQHGACRQAQAVPGRKTREGLKKAVERGVEFWVAETRMEMVGISLLSYHNATDSIRGW